MTAVFSRHSRFLLFLLIAAVVLATGIGLYLLKPWQVLNGDGGDGPLELIELSNRDFDGSPALALTFNHPLDPRHNYDQHLQVIAMPMRPGETLQKDEGEDSHETHENGAPAKKPKSEVSTAPADLDSSGGELVKGSWVVGENPRLLYFPHIKPQTRYIVRIGADLPERSARKTLQIAQSISIWTQAVAPAYYFASRGMVLPAQQNGGLPVVTVNVPEVDIQFLKIKAEQMPRFLERVIGAAQKDTAQHTPSDEEIQEQEGDSYYYRRNNPFKGATDGWELDKLHTLTDSVYSGRFLTEQKSNRRSVTFIPVEDIKELQEPGIYLAVMSQPNRFRYDYQVTYFYVSDLGLHTRLLAKSADAFVASLRDGRGLRGVTISWLDAAGKTLAQAETDGDGRAHFAERPKEARVILARQGKQMSLIALREPALDLSEFDISGLPGHPVRLFAYSGRNLYRPGESFELSVIARDADGRPVAAQPIQAILKRPDGKSQFTSTWQADATHAGYYRHKIELPTDAPTGFWTLELRADPANKLATNSYRFGVEEFLPERMKLDLKADASVLNTKKPFEIAVKGQYLYGAPAADNRLLGVIQYERNKNPLAQKLPGFEFGDVNEDSARQRKELEETTLDEDGEAKLTIDAAPVAERHSPFTLRATLSLLESGGRPVIRSIERVFWPAATLVGVRPLFVGDYAREGSLAEFEVARANAEGKLFPAAALPARLFREDRQYYWRFEDQRGWHSGFTETDELVHSAALAIPAAGRGKLAVPVKYGRYRLEIFDPETGMTTKYRFYAGWNAKSDEAQGVRPDRVALKFDKPAYKEGETARLTITPPHGGETLITVEGDKTLWTQRMKLPAEGGTVEIPIDANWKRHDLYVTAMVVRPGDEGEKVTPARALGLAHLALERKERTLTVKLDAPKKMLPDTRLKVKINVPDAKWQKAYVTLSAVDVGILNITNFATPAPHEHFFGKLRYGADLYDIYGRLIEKMAGQKGKLKFGGDAAPKPTRDLPKKVRLVDLFSGPVALNEQGEAEIALNVPDFNGTLRLMAVVAGSDKFGSSDAEVVVAAPLVAELATPRFLTIGDSATIALDLHNLSGATQKLKVTISSASGLALRKPEQELTLKDQQKAVLRFPLEAGSAYGLANVQVKVGGDLKLERNFALQVQAATPSQHVIRYYSLAPGESLELKDAELGGLLRATIASHLVVADKAPIDVRAAIQGLLTYPYGCAEQTTSTAYPHVFIDDEAAKRFGLKAYSREQRAEMLEKAIARLATMQAPNGGFSLWGNVSEYQYWLSSYISNFLLDAREQGFNVPAAMQKKAGDFLLKALQEGTAGLPSAKTPYNEDSVWRDTRYSGAGRWGVLAYGGYVLARESKAPLSTLRQLFELRAQAHSSLALTHLGLALKLMGDEARAQTALAEAVKKPRDAGYWWGDYGSPLRDAALSYALLERHKIEIDGRDNLVMLVANELKANSYHSTQEKLALFLVGREMSQSANPTDSAPWRLEIGDENLSGSGASIRPLTAAQLANGIKLKNSHKERLYLELNLDGYAAKMPAARSDQIGLTRELFDGDGQPIGNRALKVGETVLVKLAVKAKRHIGNGLVVDRIPAGLEIENLNIVQGERMGAVMVGDINPAEAMADARIKHVEFRDDRFVAAVNLRDEVVLFYRARVVTPGKFLIPPLYAEDMYRPEVYGMTAGGGALTVTDDKEEAEE